MNYIDRPEFSEGQLLSAADLQLAVDYPREELEAHCRYAHTSGVIYGMTAIPILRRDTIQASLSYVHDIGLASVAGSMLRLFAPSKIRHVFPKTA
jgi:hypothetical protein